VNPFADDDDKISDGGPIVYWSTGAITDGLFRSFEP